MEIIFSVIKSIVFNLVVDFIECIVLKIYQKWIQLICNSGNTGNQENIDELDDNKENE